MQYSNRPTSGVPRKRLRWFRRLLYRIRNRKHRKLKDHRQDAEGQLEEDKGHSRTSAPSTSGYDQPGPAYLQSEQQKMRRKRHPVEVNKGDKTVISTSKQTMGYPALKHPAYSSAQPNRYVETPGKPSEQVQTSHKLATYQKQAEPARRERESQHARHRDSIPLNLELHPIYDLHDTKTNNSRVGETDGESLTSPHHFLENTPNLSPRVRESIDRVYAWDIQGGERSDPDCQSDEWIDEESPAEHKHKVHFDMSVDEPPFDSDFQNVRNRLQAEQTEKRRRKLKRKRRHGRVKRKLVERFLRPRHYKPLREDPEDRAEIRAIEAEFEQKRFVISVSPTPSPSDFPYQEPRQSTSKRIRKAASSSYRQVVRGMESVTLEPPVTVPEYRTLHHRDGRTVIEATV